MTEFDLLNQYATRRDAEAFALLVERYQRLIYSTCRRRVHDPADVEDAVQETFLRMARSAGTLRSNVAGWLHRCATNVSTDLNRRRDARSHYESKAVRDFPSDNAQQELAELREHLDAAMEKLNPVERELIIQRFFVGRSQVEIATEAKVAASTISLRINQAIDHLRDHLKGAGYVVAAAVLVGGLEKEAASAAIPPGLSAKIARVGLTGVAAAGIGFAMKAFLVSLLLLIAIVGAVIFSLWKNAKHPPSPAIAAAPVTGPVALTVDTGNGAVTNSPAWRPTQPGIAPAGPLSGRVTGRDGKPIAGASVSLNGFNVKTDSNGQYIFNEQAVTNGEGRLTVKADGFQELGGIHDSSPTLTISPRTPTVRNIVLDRGVTITIQIRDPHGNPLPAAQVESCSTDVHSGQAERLTVDSSGIATATVAPSKTPWLITATMQGFAPAHAEVDCESVDKPMDIELVMSQGRTVDGVALCADGKPASGWGIAAMPVWSRSDYSPDVAKIDSTGKFKLEHIVAGQYRLSIARQMEQQPIGEYTLPATDGGPVHVSVPGNSPAGLFTLTGIVKCNRAANDSIELNIRGSNEGSSFSRMVMVSTNGYVRAEDTKKGLRFTVPDMPAGTYKLIVDSTEIENTVLDHVKVPGKPVTINVTIAGKPHLHGTVVDPLGIIVTRFALRVRQTEHLGSGPYYVQEPDWIQVSDPNGRFDVELVGPGVYQAEASVPGYAWTLSPSARVEKIGGAAETEIKLTVGGTLRGKIVSATSQPVVGAKVIPLSMASTSSYGRGEPSVEAGAVVTDARGQFEIFHLAPGDESVKVVDADFAPLVATGLKIVESQTTNAAPTVLHVGGSVDGTVYDSHGNPASGVTIDCQDDEYYHHGGELAEHRFGSAVADSAGHFRVDHLPDQEICVVRSYEEPGVNDGVARRTVHPVDGQTVQADFGGLTPVRGRFLMAGKPVPHTRLTFSLGDSNFGSTIIYITTDADGKFILYGPPPGIYAASCGNESSFNGELILGDFELTKSSNDIGDIIRDTGQIDFHLDPADAANVQEVGIERIHETKWFKRTLGFAVASDGDPTRWIAKEISAGQLIASIQINTAGIRKFRVPFERKSGAAAVSVTIPRFPPATATMATTAVALEDRNLGWIVLRSEDDLNEVSLGNAPAALRTIAVPPGSYRVIDAGTNEARPEIPAIKAVAGVTTLVDVAACLAIGPK